MSASKRGGGADSYYNVHLFGSGGQFLPNEAAQRENMIARGLGRVLTEIAVSRFKWHNLPPGINERFLELCLFHHALAVVYFDRDYDKLLAVRGTGTGYVNMLDDPVSFQVLGPGTQIYYDESNEPIQFKNKTIGAYMPVAHYDKPDEERRLKAIPIWANRVRFPDIDLVNIYASRIAMLDRTIEINAVNARRTKFLKGTQNTTLSAMNVANSLTRGEDVILVQGDFNNMDFIEALDLGIDPNVHDKMHILRTRQWNEIMGLLGINGSNQDKKERLVADEVSANDDQIEAAKNVSLIARKQAVELINDVFGENIEVEWNNDVEELAKAMKQQALMPDTNQQEGEDTDASVHDGTE